MPSAMHGWSRNVLIQIETRLLERSGKRSLTSMSACPRRSPTWPANR
jgi:hypothetical protein